MHDFTYVADTKKRKNLSRPLHRMGVVPHLSAHIPREAAGHRSDIASTVARAFGLATTRRNLDLVRCCLPAFKRIRVSEGTPIVDSTSSSRYAYIIISGVCVSAGVELREGSWIGLESENHRPQAQAVTTAASPKVRLLEISRDDFIHRLPKELSMTLSNRLRAIARTRDSGFHKSIRISAPLMSSRRTPHGPSTARLVDIGEFARVTSRTRPEPRGGLTTTR